MKKFLVFLIAIVIVVGAIFLVKYLTEDHISAIVVDATVNIDGQTVKIEGPGMLTLERDEKFENGYCYNLHGFVFQNIESDYIFDLFDVSYVNRWKKHVVPIKLNTNNHSITSLSAELGIIQNNNFVSIDKISEEAGLDSNELKSLTETDLYVNLNEKTQLALTYFTELVGLTESTAFSKIQGIKPNSRLTLKISAKTKKNTIDFYFIFDAKEIHLSENN